MTMPRPRSLYDVLNVSPHAEAVVIEAAYKALIKKYHPDQAPEAEVFSPAAADINKAFKVLKDPSRRAEYDHRLWVREQAMRAAELQAGVPRRSSRFAAFAGWAMALVLGAAVAAMALGGRLEAPARVLASRDAPAPVAEEAEARAPVPAFLSKERIEADLKALRAATAAQVANAQAPPPPAPRIEVAANAPPPPEPAAAALDDRAAAAAPKAPRPRAKPPRRKAAPKQQGDFLEREGYIY
jgi:hypothetical protein